MERLLEAHGLTYADLDPAALASVRDDEGRARVVRMAVTNRELRKHGGAPLLLCPSLAAQAGEEEAAAAGPSGLVREDTLGRGLGLTPAEQDAVARIPGLTTELYLTKLRGSYGTVLGLRLHEQAFKRARRVCAHKGAVRLRDDPDASRAYLGERLCIIARAPATNGRRPPPAAAGTNAPQERSGGP